MEMGFSRVECLSSAIRIVHQSKVVKFNCFFKQSLFFFFISFSRTGVTEFICQFWFGLFWPKTRVQEVLISLTGVSVIGMTAVVIKGFS